MNNSNYCCEVVKLTESNCPKVTPASGNVYNCSSKKIIILNTDTSRINHRPLVIMDGCNRCCEINTVSLTCGLFQVLP